MEKIVLDELPEDDVSVDTAEIDREYLQMKNTIDFFCVLDRM